MLLQIQYKLQCQSDTITQFKRQEAQELDQTLQEHLVLLLLVADYNPLTF